MAETILFCQFDILGFVFGSDDVIYAKYATVFAHDVSDCIFWQFVHEGT